jgi:Zn-dependent alcohol dehydrogenase
VKTRGAILREVPGRFEVVELDLEGPRPGELMVRMAASGMCHSDDHVATGDLPSETLPTCGGHEGAGVVVEVGAGTPVGVTSAIKIDPSVPLESACLVGCGVNTGWGSAVNIAEVQPNDTVIVMGIGGIGAFAVQGALHAGAANVIAVDPVGFKREMAQQLGATHVAEDITEAAELARSMTNGQGADSAIITVGVLDPEYVRHAFAAIRKAGSCVVTSLGPSTDFGAPISLFELTLYQKRLLGSMFGGVAPMRDIGKMLELYQAGRLKLDEVITTRYTLDQVEQGYADMHAGTNVRGVIVFPDAA